MTCGDRRDVVAFIVRMGRRCPPSLVICVLVGSVSESWETAKCVVFCLLCVTYLRYWLGCRVEKTFKNIIMLLLLRKRLTNY